MFDALAVGGEAATAVESIDSVVEGLVYFAEVSGHEVGVVEVGQRCVGMVGAVAKSREQELCQHRGFRLYW